MADRFSLKSWTRDGGSFYAAPHELHNDVVIHFPAGYWGDVMSPPGWVDIEAFVVTPGDMSIEHIMARARMVTDRSGIAADDDPSMRPDGFMRGMQP